MNSGNVISELLRAAEILDRAPIPVRNRIAWVNIKGKVVSVNALQGKRKGKRKRKGQRKVTSNRKELTPMNFKHLVSQTAGQLPGSTGAAQVGQVAKKLFDIMCVSPEPEILAFFAKRRKMLSARIMKRVNKDMNQISKERKGSANCILPRERKK